MKMEHGPYKGKDLTEIPMSYLRESVTQNWPNFHEGLIEAFNGEIQRRLNEHACPGGMEIDWDDPETGRILDELEEKEKKTPPN